MYQGIKKDDSVTSILLFIFNVFLTEQGIREIPLKTILKVLEPFQKSETALRMGLSRGMQNGLLSNFKKGNEVYYGLTDHAVETFKDWWSTIRKFNENISRQRADWDGTWNMLFIKNKFPDELMQSIKQLGFGSLSRELWVSPYDHSGSIVELSKKNKLRFYLFQSKLIENSRPDNLVNDIWPITELAKEYNQYLEDLGKTTGHLNQKSFKNGKGLPILHLFGIRLLWIIKQDPQLPLQLLPENWMGVRAVEKFFRIRELILPGSKDFIDKALEGPLV